MNKTSNFISIEGIDLTGKSTICRKIVRKLKEQKRNVILVSDPPSIQPWKNMKFFFESQQKISILSEAFLLLSARLDNYEKVIKPALERGDIVISDRYVDSWFVYQSYKLESYFSDIDEVIDFLISVNEFFCSYSLLSMPDITILIDEDPQEALKRTKYRNRISKYEDIETQKAIQNIYLKIANKFSSRFKVINAKNKDLDTIFKEIYILCEDTIGEYNEL